MEPKKIAWVVFCFMILGAFAWGISGLKRPAATNTKTTSTPTAPSPTTPVTLIPVWSAVPV